MKDQQKTQEAREHQPSNKPDPQNMFELLWRVFSSLISNPIALTITLISIIGLLFVSDKAGYRIDTANLPFITKETEKPKEVDTEKLPVSDAWIKAVEKAKADKKKFIVDSLTIMVDVEKASIPKMTNNHVQTIRNIYTIKAIEHIKKDTVIVTETFTIAKESLGVTYWRGSESERAALINSDSVRYDVSFDTDLTKGESRTFVTGSKVTYKTPLPNGRGSVIGVNLGPFENAILYVNDNEQIINELNIIVESETLKIQPLSKDNAMEASNEGNKCSMAKSFQNGTEGTLVARWTNIEYKQKLALCFSWEEIKK